MAHISLPTDLPGILGPLSISQDTAKPLLALAHQLLHVDRDGLPRAERELIASYVSYLNGCIYCSEVHGAVADVHNGTPGWARRIWNDTTLRTVSRKLRALLIISGKVQGAPREVSNADIAAARAAGANDMDIHNAVLIASAFCMFNRYVDGLATTQPPQADAFYQKRAEELAKFGYLP